MPKTGTQSAVRVKKTVLGAGSLVLLAIVVMAVHILALGAVAGAESGSSAFTAVGLHEGENRGSLDPAQTRWYAFVQARDDGALERQMELTLIFTPDDGHRSQQVGFQVWAARPMRGGYRPDASSMQSAGRGEVVSRDGDPATGELLWSGWAVYDNTYLVEIFNNSQASIVYRLFPDNVVGAPLGEGRALSPPLEAPAGADPAPPEALKPHYQAGQLAAGEETWYPIVSHDYDGDVYEAHTVTLVFTPDDGRRVQQVGFEVIPAEQWRSGQRGLPRESLGIGVSQAVSRDPDPLTGERLWSGWLIDGRSYHIRVHNDADRAIDYWLFSD